jgi:hypothetical protein
VARFLIDGKHSPKLRRIKPYVKQNRPLAFIVGLTLLIHAVSIVRVRGFSCIAFRQSVFS